jgi:hypothetical protein
LFLSLVLSLLLRLCLGLSWFFLLRLYLGHPQLIVCLVDLSVGISIDHLSGLTVDYSRGWVTCAFNNLSDLILGGSKRLRDIWIALQSFPGAFLASIATDNDDLKVLLTVFVPFIIKRFKLDLERSASRSPICVVENHNELITHDADWSNCLPACVDKVLAQEANASQSFRDVDI